MVSPVWDLTIHNGSVFAGATEDGKGVLLRSDDRNFWSKVYTVDDVCIKSVKGQNNSLFFGTSPNGKIYIRNITTGETNLSQELGGDIYDFLYFKNEMYVAGGLPTQIFKYDSSAYRWNSIYQTPSRVVSRLIESYGKMYVFMDGPNYVAFDGTDWESIAGNGVGNEFVDPADWKLLLSTSDNISSIRSSSLSQFSHISNDFIDSSSIKSVERFPNLENEDIYDVFPVNHANGIKGVDVDGSSFAMGTSEYGRVYNLIDNKLVQIFQSESGNTVHSILNIEVGVNLVAIDNTLYLVHCGKLPSEIDKNEIVEEIPTTTTTTTTDEIPVIGITFPQGGEIFSIGDTVTIQWTSDKSVNDIVSVVLYKDGNEVYTINGGTSNDGNYDWLIPNAFLDSPNYRIRFTWVSAGNSDRNHGESGLFTITNEEVTTTTTSTTTTIDVNLPDTSSCRGIPLLELREDEYIVDMIKDVSNGGILMSTSRGRVLGCHMSLVNSYLTGEREVFAEVKDGFGNESETASTNFFYGLYNKIAEINEDKEIVKWVFKEKPTSVLTDRINGVFISPILSVKQDLNAWKQLLWKEIKPDNTDIIICIRAADSVSELRKLSWDYCFVSEDEDRGYGSDGFIIRDINDYQIRGKYLQFKVTMITDSNNVSPVILNLGISYSTSFSVYFFTTKFILENNANAKSGMIVANVTEPINTKVQFGIADSNSSDWNNYTVVEPNKIFELENFENLKVGIKMIAYDNDVPEVSEFAVLNGADKDTLINE